MPQRTSHPFTPALQLSASWPESPTVLIGLVQEGTGEWDRGEATFYLRIAGGSPFQALVAETVSLRISNDCFEDSINL